jgi:hypothetical protein
MMSSSNFLFLKGADSLINLVTGQRVFGMTDDGYGKQCQEPVDNAIFRRVGEPGCRS